MEIKVVILFITIQASIEHFNLNQNFFMSRLKRPAS